ncbi:MAG TPA: MFS transporter, partial [Thermoanaerobaculia bacterium]
MRRRRLSRHLHPGERRLVALSALYFFALLAAYYVLRPIRDEGSVRVGVARIPWLFTATFAAMILVVPAFGWLASRVPRRRFLPGMHLFFAGNLALFAASLPRPGLERWAGPAFFVWVAVVNVFAVSVSWSFMSDVFRREEARRLFGLVAAGGSAGAIVGPAVAAVTAPRLGHGALLLGAAGLYAACAAIAGRLA